MEFLCALRPSLDGIVAAMRAGGNVLMPIDSAGRVLELLLCLDQHWP